MPEGILLSELRELHNAGHLILAAVKKIEELEKANRYMEKCITDMGRDYRELMSKKESEIMTLRGEIEGLREQDIYTPLDINQALTNFNRDYICPLKDRVDRLEQRIP